MSQERKLGEVKRYGRVTTVRRGETGEPGAWMVYVGDDKARWDAGRTEVEAMGKLVITHHDALWP